MFRLTLPVEGQPDVLIQNGLVMKDRLDKEAVTIAELEAAVNRQGFSSLHEVDRAVLESGGRRDPRSREGTRSQ